jgi:hypothetical protein
MHQGGSFQLKLWMSKEQKKILNQTYEQASKQLGIIKVLDIAI